MEIHVHIHNSDQDKKFDRILEAIEKWHDRDLDELIKKLKAIKKDVKNTPTE